MAAGVAGGAIRREFRRFSSHRPQRPQGDHSDEQTPRIREARAWRLGTLHNKTTCPKVSTLSVDVTEAICGQSPFMTEVVSPCWHRRKDPDVSFVCDHPKRGGDILLKVWLQLLSKWLSEPEVRLLEEINIGAIRVRMYNCNRFSTGQG